MWRLSFSRYRYISCRPVSLKLVSRRHFPSRQPNLDYLAFSFQCLSSLIGNRKVCPCFPAVTLSGAIVSSPCVLRVSVMVGCSSLSATTLGSKVLGRDIDGYVRCWQSIRIISLSRRNVVVRVDIQPETACISSICEAISLTLLVRGVVNSGTAKSGTAKFLMVRVACCLDVILSTSIQITQPASVARVTVSANGSTSGAIIRLPIIFSENHAP